MFFLYLSLKTVLIYFDASGEFIASGFFIKNSLRGPFLGTAFFVGFFEGDAFVFFEGEGPFPLKKKILHQNLKYTSDTYLYLHYQSL